MNTVKNNHNIQLHHAVNIINDFYKQGYNWHPDDDFLDYIEADGQPISTSEALSLNNRLADLCTLCDEVGVDVYELSLLFSCRSYEMVTAYFEDGLPCIGFKDVAPFTIGLTESEDLGDGMNTIYINL